MLPESRTQKRPRVVGVEPGEGINNDTNMNQPVDVEIHAEIMEQEQPPISYASQAMNVPRPSDVRIDKTKNAKERAKVQVF